MEALKHLIGMKFDEDGVEYTIRKVGKYRPRVEGWKSAPGYVVVECDDGDDYRITDDGWVYLDSVEQGDKPLCRIKPLFEGAGELKT